jgi:ribosomal protein L29
MKKAEKKVLRATAAADLATQAKQAREAMFKARLAVAAEGKPIGVKYRALRRQVARLETILREKAQVKP